MQELPRNAYGQRDAHLLPDYPFRQNDVRAPGPEKHIRDRMGVQPHICSGTLGTSPATHRFNPSNKPQSIRMRLPPTETRYFDPVTVPVAPRNWVRMVSTVSVERTGVLDLDQPNGRSTDVP